MFYRSNKKKAAIALALSGLAAIMTGCGSSPTAGVVAPPGAIQPNYNPNPMPAQCAPINGPIGFTAQNITLTTNTIKFGNIPAMYDPNGFVPSVNPGAVIITGAGGTPGQYNTLSTAVDGRVSLNITPGTADATTGRSSTSNATGVIYIAADRQKELLYGSGVGFSMIPTSPGATTPNVATYCVSSAAASLSIGDGTKAGGDRFTLYRGSVVLTTTLGQLVLYF